MAAPAAKPKSPPGEAVDAVGGTARGRSWLENRVKDTPLPAAAWPSAGRAEIDLSAAPTGRGVRAGTLPVWVDRGAGDAGRRLERVEVEVLDRAAVPAV
ncbi:MAG: hypothetical protein HOV79_13960 [Hamadaea sp.]|nr:hypothetical protein [Hamadaea sp.]